MTVPHRTTKPGICEIEEYAGPDAGPRVDLLLEVPHGADRASDFDDLAAELRGPFREDLRDFYFVNTDVGAAALARATAKAFVAAHPARRALLVDGRIPRTFVDCNRILDVDPSADAEEQRKVTPGLPPWIVDPADDRLLRSRYAEYQRVIEAAYERTCAGVGSGGRALMLHSYAPRSLDVPVDDQIVDRLREEYRPENIERWPLRPAVDLIATDPEGTMFASRALVEATQTQLTALDVEVTVSACYSLLPGTVAERLARRYPDRTLCIEFRRDLLVEEFTPFAEMTPDVRRIQPLAAALAGAAGDDGATRSGEAPK